MTESRAFVLILVGVLVCTAIGVLGMAALGFNGSGMFLGALVPLAIGADLNSRVVIHYGGKKRRRKR
jgi:hypothetical protein